MTTDPTRTVWDALEAAGCDARGEPWRGTARCPAHEDGSASLSIGVGGDGRALLYCHRGCPAADVVAALGLQMADLFPRGHRRARPVPGVGRAVPMVDLVLGALRELGIDYRATLNPLMWAAERCPACGPGAPAQRLWILEDDRGRVILSCANGCDRLAVLDALAGFPVDPPGDCGVGEEAVA